MPKLIVLVFDDDSTAWTLAQSAAAGAKRVRFTEVDLRMVGGTDASAVRVKPLESMDRITEYDGVVISASGGATAPPALASMFEQLEHSASAGAYANTVFGIVGNDATLLGRVAQLGGIIVTEPHGSADHAGRADALGARMAKVVEWVRHALSHEQKDHAHQHHHH